MNQQNTEKQKAKKMSGKNWKKRRKTKTKTNQTNKLIQVL